MKIGFIVGRFQSPELHYGYIHIINKVLDQCDFFSIVLSRSPIASTERNPTTIEERKVILTNQLILKGLFNNFAGFVIVNDLSSNEVWSDKLDESISNFSTEYFDKYGDSSKNEIGLFGSRDSFIEVYSGNNKIHLLPEYSDNIISSTIVRKSILENIKDYYIQPGYFAGKLQALSEQFPTSFNTVDIAVLNHDESEVILGRKPNEKLWRFPGGFVDPTDPTLEYAAKREVIEECGNIETGDYRYIASVRINDWRYGSEKHKILTTFFRSKIVYGYIKAGDDLEEVKWAKISEVDINEIGVGHRILFQKLLETL